MRKKLLGLIAVILLSFSFVGFISPKAVYAAPPGCYVGGGTADRPSYRATPCPNETAENQVSQGRCFLVVGSSISSINCASFDEGTNNDTANVPSEEEVLSEDCSYSGFFGIPPWYKYLKRESINDPVTGGTACNVIIDNLSDIWFIVAAGIEILLRIAALVAVGFVIYGGVLYIISQSQPDKTAQALKTVLNALVGLAIAIVATAVVSFIAGSFN